MMAIFRTSGVLAGLCIAAGMAATAAGQVSVSIGSGFGHRNNVFVSGAHCPTTIVGHPSHGFVHHPVVRPGSVVVQRGRPGFFSYHDYQPRQYRIPSTRRTVVVSDPFPTVFTPVYGSGTAFISSSSRRSSSGVFIGGSSSHCVSSSTVQFITPPAPRVVRETVVVERPVERTVFIERETPERYGRQSVREPDRGSLIGDAERAHRAGDWHAAIRLYEEAISYRQDVAEARRGLAIVYLEMDQVSEAIRQIERAYEDEPSLAFRVFNDRILEGSRLGYAIEVAQRTAERQSSARSWLLVGVLRQASGDREGAVLAIREASRFGLHHRVVDSFYSALGR